MPPKKIPQPAADQSRHPSQHANDRRVAQYNAAKLDDELQAYAAGQRAAKRKIQGMGGYMRQVRHDPIAAQVAHDALE